MLNPAESLKLMRLDLAELLRQEPNNYQKHGDLKTKIADLEKAVAAAPPPEPDKVVALEALVRQQAELIARLTAAPAPAPSPAAPAAPSKPFPPAP